MEIKKMTYSETPTKPIEDIDDLIYGDEYSGPSERQLEAHLMFKSIRCAFCIKKKAISSHGDSFHIC